MVPPIGIGFRGRRVAETRVGMSVSTNDPLQVIRRRVRLLMLLDGAKSAGIAPMRLRQLHTYAYLVNVLAPVWSTSSLDGSLLKRPDGPFYPALQYDLDRLIGLGLVDISDLGHVLDQDGRWRLDGRVDLNLTLARRTLDVVRSFPEERDVEVYIREIGFAVTSLTAFGARETIGTGSYILRRDDRVPVIL